MTSNIDHSLFISIIDSSGVTVAAEGSRDEAGKGENRSRDDEISKKRSRDQKGDQNGHVMMYAEKWATLV